MTPNTTLVGGITDIIEGGGQSPPASFENDAQSDATIAHQKVGRLRLPLIGIWGKPHTPCRPFAPLRVAHKDVVYEGFNATDGLE
jgi:hypothetical protein